QLFVARYVEFEMFPAPIYCAGIGIPSERLAEIMTITIRATLLAAEVIVIVVTWWYTYGIHHGLKGLGSDSSLASVMLHNADAISASVMGVLNILHIICYVLDTPSLATLEQIVGTLIDPLSSILVSRFVLSLRHVDHPIAPLTATEQASITLQFARDVHRTTLPSFVASLGELVHVGSRSAKETFDSETGSDIELSVTGTNPLKIEEVPVLMSMTVGRQSQERTPV
ncbi:hypothetical protein BD311DRAFT_656098, partial [Dichomitus squalens]